MENQIETVYLDDGNMQRYQIISDFNWKEVNFTSFHFNKQIIKEMAHLFRINIIPKDPSFYGTLIFYNLPSSFILDLNNEVEIGKIYKPQILLNHYFQEAANSNELKIVKDKLIFQDEKLQNIYKFLEDSDRIAIEKGKSDEILFLPLDSALGHLSDNCSTTVICNSHFFLMEKTDRDSPYDEIGTPHSLALKDGKILLPPLNHRESLLVDYNNKVQIAKIEITDLKIKIDDHIFEDQINSTFYYRPENRITAPIDGIDIVIVADKVVAIKKGGNTQIPMAGFVIQTKMNDFEIKNITVEYLGKTQEFLFGVQVGPAMMTNNIKTKSLTCPFYKGEGTPFPSTVYPLDFDKGRAARIGIGEKEGRSLLIWAEGAGKLGYEKGKESCGASLKEFADFCENKSITNLINLDGGGSAQIIYKNKRYLKIADRKADTVTEAERPVPYGITL